MDFSQDPGDAFHFTYPLRVLQRRIWYDVREHDTDLHISLPNGNEHVMRGVGVDKWSLSIDVADPEMSDLVLKNCMLVAKWTGDDFPYSFLCCKAGEMQYAHFWGKLLCVADKYCVDKLAELCEERMTSRLSVWSAVPMLEYACLASRPSLKRDILKFITLDDDFFQGVKDMPEYDSLGQDLQNEITEAFLQRLRMKKKRPACPGSPRSSPERGREFADEQDWELLSCAQLRRACAERALATGRCCRRKSWAPPERASRARGIVVVVAAVALGSHVQHAYIGMLSAGTSLQLSL